ERDAIEAEHLVGLRLRRSLRIDVTLPEAKVRNDHVVELLRRERSGRHRRVVREEGNDLSFVEIRRGRPRKLLRSVAHVEKVVRLEVDARAEEVGRAIAVEISGREVVAADGVLRIGDVDARPLAAVLLVQERADLSAVRALDLFASDRTFADRNDVRISVAVDVFHEEAPRRKIGGRHSLARVDEVALAVAEEKANALQVDGES